MGFTTGFLGGAALTTSILYLSVHTHRANRRAQATAIRAHAIALLDVTDPHGPRTSDNILRLPTVEREERAGVAQIAKDRWNGEVEGLVRKVAGVDWGLFRENVEDVLAAAWRSVRG